MMCWNTLLTPLRFESEDKPRKQNHDEEFERTQFQRDYDRIVFSSPFRRLQNKTQVFPLPGSVLVHNRLTHSLEVACVGRSLGSMLSAKLKQDQQYKDNPFIDQIGNIIAAACLAHDMGNPAFGHSGEKAISQYFISNTAIYRSFLNETEWNDLTNFEGNANALRLLTHRFNNRAEGPFGLTYPTLAAIVKYPCQSTARDKSNIHRKKYGFFNSEKETFVRIAQKLGMVKTQDNPLAYSRYPLAYLVEAADDICYNIIDIEDAHRLKIFTDDEVLDLLLPSCGDESQKTRERLRRLNDSNDKISLLRAKSISTLTQLIFEAFWRNHDAILKGKLNTDLKACLPSEYKLQLEKIGEISTQKIYNYRSVVEKEIAGYKIIGGLLEEFIPMIISEKRSHYQDKLMQLFPLQFMPTKNNAYSKMQAVLDFVSGMTDIFAVELYKRIKGTSFPELS
ncbi:MAG: deoxyguanosinetriphosphate triphosphohydrolase [Prevotellaceae bacterium]|jgi:dGTPase|nr:deoxyguanosinetriphosphate triphosphohydrolase [Prevotellaceae bacterium]